MIEYSKKAVKYINSTDKATKKRLREAIEKIPFGDIITPAVKYRTILLAQISICCVVINRCSTRCSSIFRLAYEDLFCAI